MTESPRSQSPLRRVIAVAVGLFATWQLVYLPGANLIDFVPRRTGPPLEPVNDTHQKRGTFTSVEPLQRAAEHAGDALDFWSELSGQEQGWSLFAPGLPPYSVFPAVEFRFADGTGDTALSQFEPADKQKPPPRPPLVNNRLFNFEAQFTYPAMYAPPEEVAARYTPPELLEQMAAALRERYCELPDDARSLRAPVRAWLAWRTKEFLAAHPQRGTPTEVILKHRFVTTPKPGEPAEWTRPVHERPFAKWRPADDSYEVYDVLGGRFVLVEAKP